MVRESLITALSAYAHAQFFPLPVSFLAEGGGGGGGSARGGVDLPGRATMISFLGTRSDFLGKTPCERKNAEEADRIYETIDKRVDTRRRRRREAAQLEAMKKESEERPSIGDQFADLNGKHAVSAVNKATKCTAFSVCFLCRGVRARRKIEIWSGWAL